MTKERKMLILFGFILLSSGILAIFNKLKSEEPAKNPKLVASEAKARIDAKAKQYSRAPAIENFATELGTKVILVNFWSSTCANCQKEIVHLNAWYAKYKEMGLEIVGVHTPMFEFEKDSTRLASVAGRLGIKYPVVEDNDYKIWFGYKNTSWPNVYLVDSDGFVVYSHIGEGAYDEVEGKIQELLNKKDLPLEASNAELIEFPGSPVFYFNTNKNDLLGNGKAGTAGVQTLKLPKDIELNKLYLAGKWDFQSQYAESQSAGAKIVIKYNAREVYFVAGSSENNKLTVVQDSKPIMEGEIKDDDLYQLVTDESAGEHTLEITADKPGLRAYIAQFR